MEPVSLSSCDYYLILASKSVRLQNRVSPILKAVTFLAEPSARELRQANEYFKLKDGAIDKMAPVEFLTPEERQAVSRDGRFSVSLYKALLFLQVQSGIKSGTLNLEHSYKYRPLDAYLIDRDRWRRDKSLLIERAGLQAFIDPHRVLAELDEALYQQYLSTNGHIDDGDNPFIKFQKDGFTVSTPTHQHLEGAGENQLRFQVRLGQTRDFRGEQRASVGLEGAKPVELQDRRLMTRHGLPRVVGEVNSLLGRADPIGNVRKVAWMEGRDGVESFGRFEIATAHEKDHLVGGRAQAGGDVLKRRGEVEAAFALGAVEDRRGIEHPALDAVQDLHTRHGRLPDL
jgi:hypothetical protein